MKKSILFLVFIGLLFISCKSSSDYVNVYKAEREGVGNSQVTLLNMIRKVPGVILRGNTPVLRGTANSISRPISEPLYVLNDYIVGQSFSSLDQLVDVSIVKKISVLDLSNAAIYGSRAANGVIVVETY